MDRDPLSQFRADRAHANKLQDPNANLCAFATIDASGRPQVRTLVLRDVENRLAVFINQTSAKWRENLSSVAVCVYFDSLKIQYRLVCTSQPISHEDIARSWQYRPDPPKRMDWLYEKHPQGSVISSRAQLIKELNGVTHENQPPHTATGLWLNATEIERLDLGQENGVHDRRCYRQNNQWQEEILVP